jgi:uncharacterized protein (DUF697 family)
MPMTEPTTDAERDVARAIRRASLTAAALGVVLSPVPLADELALLPVYGVMTAQIARYRGVGLRRVPWRPLAVTAVTGLAARAAVNLTVSYIPIVAAVANAASGMALTQFLGRYVDTACMTARHGGETRPLTLEDLKTAFKGRASA